MQLYFYASNQEIAGLFPFLPLFTKYSALLDARALNFEWALTLSEVKIKYFSNTNSTITYFISACLTSYYYLAQILTSPDRSQQPEIHSLTNPSFTTPFFPKHIHPLMFIKYLNPLPPSPLPLILSISPLQPLLDNIIKMDVTSATASLWSSFSLLLVAHELRAAYFFLISLRLQ